MQDEIIYVNTNNVIDGAKYSVAVLRITQCGFLRISCSTADPPVPME